MDVPHRAQVSTLQNYYSGPPGHRKTGLSLG
jgi:hypothetical protein